VHDFDSVLAPVHKQSSLLKISAEISFLLRKNGSTYTANRLSEGMGTVLIQSRPPV